jgi:phospholipid/cholesterol/gamma-HCH transport system substrate-binding protein
MNKEFKIGLVVIIVISMLVIGVNYLKGFNILNNSQTYHAVYEDIGGLEVGSSVMVNGYQVGMVINIDLLIEKNQNLLVTFSLNKEFNIATNSIARIVNQDLMGTKGVSLILGDASTYLEVGDTLSSSIEGSLQEEVNAQILPLKNKAEELIGSMDSVMMIITAVLNKDTRDNLSNSLKSLDKTFALMSETMLKVNHIVKVNDERISKVITNLASISSNIENSNGEIKTILTNFSIISDSLVKADIATTLQNFNKITTKINNGEGSFGLLMKDDKIYKNLEQSTKELAELIEDIKKNPSRYMNFSIVGGSTPYQKKNK